MKKVRAIGLLSGGLDSTLAAKLLIELGIEVLAVNFVSPFCRCTPKGAGCPAAMRAAQQLGNISLQRILLGEEYLRMVVSPEHGYGRGMNPCIDCRIMKLRRAAEYMCETGASFLFTGEVVGQRPMTQFRRTLELIERSANIPGLVLRPLSARLLPPTLPETAGWIDRNRLLAIQGRSRRPQIRLAYEKGVGDYPCPAGGCLLTDAVFAARLQEHLQRTSDLTLRDSRLLAIGRHIRGKNGEKIIVARNEIEGNSLSALAVDDEWLLRPLNFSGPVVLLMGREIGPALDSLMLYTRRELPATAWVECRRIGCGETIQVSPNLPSRQGRQSYTVGELKCQTK